MLMFCFTTKENAFYALLGALVLRSVPPSFLFAFGLNIRGGAHLRTSTGVAKKEDPRLADGDYFARRFQREKQKW